MRILLIYLLAGICLVWAGCSKDSNEYTNRSIKSINGTYSGTDDSKSFSYGFVYDSEGRITTLSYTGELYLHGEGFIHADYTFEADYSGSEPVVTLKTANPVIIALTTDKGKQRIPYKGIPEEEMLPVTFDEQGKITKITGRSGWFFVENMPFRYENGYLESIRENDYNYYDKRISLDWTNGNLVSQTDTEGTFSILRRFDYSGMANDYSIDLNWFTGGLGFGFQHGLTPLSLLGLTGKRSAFLIDSTTEYDESIVPIAYSLNGNTIERINWTVLGATYNYRIQYYED